MLGRTADRRLGLGLLNRSALSARLSARSAAGKRPARCRDKKSSRGARIRTEDLLLPKQARYQAAPRPARASIRAVGKRAEGAAGEDCRPPAPASIGSPAMSTMRITHIGGPTALIEVGGWRILTDPTFDAPGRRYTFAPGIFSKKLAGPALAAQDLGAIDAVLLSHDHHEDNLDPAGRALLPGAGTVVTTQSGAKRLAKQGATNAQGLGPWQ